jgi:hypothetical protein
MRTRLTRGAVAVALIVAGSALASHAQSKDDAVRGVLISIASGQVSYWANCGHGFYAPSLAVLGRSAPGQLTAFILAEYVPPKGAPALERFRYRFELAVKPAPKSPAGCNGAAAGTLAETYTVTARPMLGVEGPSYQMDHEGKITEIK